MQEASSGCREQRATRHTGQQPKAAGAGAGGSGRRAPTSELGPGLPLPHGFPGFTSQQVSHFAPDPCLGAIGGAQLRAHGPRQVTSTAPRAPPLAEACPRLPGPHQSRRPVHGHLRTPGACHGARCTVGAQLKPNRPANLVRRGDARAEWPRQVPAATVTPGPSRGLPTWPGLHPHNRLTALLCSWTLAGPRAVLPAGAGTLDRALCKFKVPSSPVWWQMCAPEAEVG